jgi:hypothetical protein
VSKFHLSDYLNMKKFQAPFLKREREREREREGEGDRP